MKNKKMIMIVLLVFMGVGVIFGGIIPAIQNSKAKDKQKSESVSVEENFKTGEIEINELTEKLSNSEFELKRTKYESNIKNAKKTIDVKLDFEGKALIVGAVNNIREIVANYLENDYDVINLMITQSDPTDFVKYTYENGTWDKEVK